MGSLFQLGGTPLTCLIMTYRLVRSPGSAGPTHARCTTPQARLMRATSRRPAGAGASPAPPTMTRLPPSPPVLARAPLATTGTRSTQNTQRGPHHRIPPHQRSLSQTLWMGQQWEVPSRSPLQLPTM
ncbi:MAG: hypothetical protein ACFFC7_08720 [Candidatus Hermodarchaeota archaeon]